MKSFFKGFLILFIRWYLLQNGLLSSYELFFECTVKINVVVHFVHNVDKISKKNCFLLHFVIENKKVDVNGKINYKV